MTWPRSLIPTPTLEYPSGAPRSAITLASQRNACMSPEAVVLRPTTCPASLIPNASLSDPPKVPRSVIVPASQRNAWTESGAGPWLPPTIWPISLIAWAWLSVSPGRVPRSTVGRGPTKEGWMNWTVRRGRFADSLDSYTTPSGSLEASRIPSFGSRFTHRWTIDLMLMAMRPSGLGAKTDSRALVAGEPADEKLFHVTQSAPHESVT